jgi:plasmid segregation protein ParM
MQTAIGFDVGRSSVKIVAARGNTREELLFPSAVCPAFTINDDKGAARAAAETVFVGGKYFFIGETALLQGGDDLSGGLRDDWVYSEQHSALFLGGLNRLKATGMAGIESALIVVGLPGALYASQKAGLRHELGRLVPRAEIRVMPQPMGPYQELLFAPDGQESHAVNADDDSYAVIEVGQYTTDFALLLHGHTIENAFGSCDGMRIAAEHLQRSLRQSQIAVSMAEATDLLRTKTLKNFGARIDVSEQVFRAVEPLATQIVDKANQLIGKSARSLDGILVAGGGAPLVLETLQKAWPHARLSQNSRFSVAEGFCRYSLALSRYRNGTADEHEAASEVR